MASPPNIGKSPLDTIPVDPGNLHHGDIPNTPLAASLISFLLGSTFALGLILFIHGDWDGLWWARRELGFFVASWAAFHWGEFAIAAGWNREKCSVDSFLLENGKAYHIANATGLVEFLITSYFAPDFKRIPYLFPLGIAMTVGGQILRSVAMIHASSNFSHQLATRKIKTHELVTTGIYAHFRHPSYTGFFYWSLGTQVALQNPVSFIGFSVVLWRFFASRIKVEELYLIKFFGDDYKQYRRTVGTYIPFIL